MTLLEQIELAAMRVRDKHRKEGHSDIALAFGDFAQMLRNTRDITDEERQHND